MDDIILSARDIVKQYTGHRALDKVSIDVKRGRIYGLLGPNGAGKTTLIRIINHITAPDEGEVTFNGHRLTAADVANMGYLPEERGLYKKMKVGEQALFFARLKGLSKEEATRSLKEWFERLDISSWWNRKVEELSKGMAQKVQFIVTVLHNPELLIFDEPFSGFDPINANLLKNEILNLRDKGATVIFSTHNMASVEELCDDISLINKSQNILTGSVAELRRRYAENAYSFTYMGDRDAMVDAIKPMVNRIEFVNDDRDGNHRLTLRLNDAADLRTLVNTVNSTVDLRAFNELLPSMNDIFIRTVEMSNQSLPPQI